MLKHGALRVVKSAVGDPTIDDIRERSIENKVRTGVTSGRPCARTLDRDVMARTGGWPLARSVCEPMRPMPTWLPLIGATMQLRIPRPHAEDDGQNHDHPSTSQREGLRYQQSLYGSLHNTKISLDSMY